MELQDANFLQHWLSFVMHLFKSTWMCFSGIREKCQRGAGFTMCQLVGFVFSASTCPCAGGVTYCLLFPQVLTYGNVPPVQPFVGKPPLKLKSLWFIHMCQRISLCFCITSEKGRACVKIRQQRPGAVLSPSSEVFKKTPKKAVSKLGWLDSWPCLVQEVGLQISWGSLWHGWFCHSQGLCVLTQQEG